MWLPELLQKADFSLAGALSLSVLISLLCVFSLPPSPPQSVCLNFSLQPFLLACFDEASCHVLSCPAESPMWWGAESRLWPKASEEVRLSVIRLCRTASCQQPCSKGAWKQVLPRLSLERTALSLDLLDYISIVRDPAKPCLASQPTETWNYTYCLKPLSFGVISYAAIGDSFSGQITTVFCLAVNVGETVSYERGCSESKSSTEAKIHQTDFRANLSEDAFPLSDLFFWEILSWIEWVGNYVWCSRTHPLTLKWIISIYFNCSSQIIESCCSV